MTLEQTAMSSRRQLLKASGGLMSALLPVQLLNAKAIENSLPQVTARPEELVQNEIYWRRIAGQYQVTPDITNLENGYWGIMADPVLQAYHRHTDFINRENTRYARSQWWDYFAVLRAQVAQFLKVDKDEVVLTRGATEALQALITGYNRLKPGDTVIYADLDYSEMKTAMRWLEQRRGVNVVKINFPEPANHNNVIELYRRALDENPGTRLLLMTHLNNWTGLICPVAEVAAMAKERGVDIILDAAHSVGQVDFDLWETGCEFIGVNLHKWVGAPIGCGVMVIKKNRIKDIDSFLNKAPNSNKITDRIDTGTANFAAYMSIPDAIQFHTMVGTRSKQLRLKYLRDIWVGQVKNLSNIQILTPDDPKQVAALTSFRLKGETTTQGNNAISRTLAKEYGILTVRRTGPALGDCVRVTPSIYNTPEDMMKLAFALKQMASS